MKSVRTVGVVVFKENKVLLVEHKEESGHVTGTCGLPAGRVEEGEREGEAAVRELKEETGIKVREKDLEGIPTIYEEKIEREGGVKKFSMKIFHAVDYSGEISGGEETTPRWVEISELDKVDLLPNVREAISEGLENRGKLETIINLLRENYGVPERRSRGSPVESLVQVILSQNTNDRNRDRAWRRLKEKIGGPEKILEADEAEISEAISVAGLHNTKAGRIKKCLEKIKEENGELNLDFLEDMSLKEARDWLTRLPGVGPKSAAVVLNFSFGKAAFPVDTHIFRVSRRLGLIGDMTREKAHEILEKKVPGGRMHEFHLNLIRHGREICKAPEPLCDRCFLTGVCDYYKRERGE